MVNRHRGLAISLATIGSSLSGVVWPPIIQHFIAGVGWRQTHIGIGIFCLATMLPLALVLRRRPVFHEATAEAASTGNANQAIGLPPNITHALLALAGLCCCVAMAMPQIRLVAYCGDLAYFIRHNYDLVTSRQWAWGGGRVYGEGSRNALRNALGADT